MNLVFNVRNVEIIKIYIINFLNVLEIKIFARYVKLLTKKKDIMRSIMRKVLRYVLIIIKISILIAKIAKLIYAKNVKKKDTSPKKILFKSIHLNEKTVNENKNRIKELINKIKFKGYYLLNLM